MSITTNLVGLVENVDELINLAAVGLGEESVRCAFVVGSSCSANSVHVVLNVAGKVVVYDKFYIVDVFKGASRERKKRTLVGEIG